MAKSGLSVDFQKANLAYNAYHAHHEEWDGGVKSE